MLIDIKEDGTFRLDQKYFNYATGLTMTNNLFNDLFGQKVRDPLNEKITQFHMDIAASIQKVTEEIMIKLAKSVRDEYGLKNLCLAGGVALNCVANGKILKEKIFENIWIQPASGDAGSSIRAALLGWYVKLYKERFVNPNDSMKGSYLGCNFSNDEIINYLDEINASYSSFDEDKIFDKLDLEDLGNFLIPHKDLMAPLVDFL